MAQKEKEIEDREATISIFTKMIKSTKLLNALQAQWKGIEEEQKREAEDRQREDDLRNQLAQLQEFGLRKSNQKENKLKKSFEAKKLERDSLLKQEKSIQIEISTLQEKVKLSKDNASAEIEELQQKLNAQNEEIENMRNIIQNLENGLVFDKETNTEFQTQTLPTQFAPPPNQRTTQSTTNESLYSRLDALYEYANQLLNQN
ncbi:hypothetical protein GPJ56_006525 [Histomonas meleagridis]|uniref:uncharacterized protein n=1 Tax=Histomonas meleagridis TaxID=135588 RepID=UPI00355A5CBC|nr:hypothetical protein GPJ56_006525 [Histomonas meleagridis]KAH0801762.1 hypothetical protein GO595_005443 [Histomonas meleagridis]